ncbi:MAG: NAD(P)-binding domain-containing protein [Gemmatimonadetes bacterium]|nr:NAD(P)-binding domain-containing protein [Gemmatimonadota bacterium]
MRIAILGAGNVGGTLGRRWAEAGHDVKFGVRRTDAGAAAVKGGQGLPSRANVVGPAEAVRDANVVVLATPWGCRWRRAAGSRGGRRGARRPPAARRHQPTQGGLRAGRRCGR